MRFLLVDDDKLIRFSLKSMLLDICPADCFIAEASNGLEMINRCNEYDPDIAFVDIRMPNLDGLCAIEKCKELSPDTSFIVVTGYSDFAYAKECIRLGVTDYLLKPVSPDTLEDLISKCKNKLQARRHMSNNLFQLYMHDIFHLPQNSLSELSQDPEFLPDSWALLVFTVFIDCNNIYDMFSRIQNHIIHELKLLGTRLMDLHINYSIDYSPEGYLYVTYKTPREKLEYLIHKTETICQNEDNPNLHLYLYMAVLSSTDTFSHVFQLVDTYASARMDKLPCKAIDICKFTCSDSLISFYDRLHDLLDAFQNSNEILYTQSLNELYRTYRTTPPDCCYTHLSAYVQCFTGIQADRLDFKSFMKSFVTCSDEMYQNITSPNKIDLIIDYVNQSFANDISINHIADKFDLTPNYVSKLFREKTNTKFIDYLTDLRMKHAKKLLIEKSEMPMKDIALMLGYYSPRHFASTFRKYTSLSPSEYRKNHGSDPV